MEAALLPVRARRPARANKNFACWPLSHYNHNVVLNWLISAVQGVGDSIWNGVVLASFIYELFKHSNKGNAYVGYVEAAQGTIILVVSLPIGFLADKFSKSLVIRAGAICIPIAAAATIFAAQASKR